MYIYSHAEGQRMLRSYHAENARSRPIHEANLHWARLVLR